MEMDAFDEEIIRLMKENGRITHSEIGKRIHLSLPAVSERIRKLEAAGWICGYTVRLNREAMGQGLLAFLFVTLDRPEHIAPFRKAMLEEGAVLECHHLAGNFDYLLKIAVSNTRELELLLSERIKTIPGVVKTSTMIALCTVKEE